MPWGISTVVGDATELGFSSQIAGSNLCWQFECDFIHTWGTFRARMFGEQWEFCLIWVLLDDWGRLDIFLKWKKVKDLKITTIFFFSALNNEKSSKTVFIESKFWQIPSIIENSQIQIFAAGWPNKR